MLDNPRSPVVDSAPQEPDIFDEDQSFEEDLTSQQDFQSSTLAGKSATETQVAHHQQSSVR